MKLRQSTDQALRGQALEGLALAGYIDPVKGRGIRILTLDGGGIRYIYIFILLEFNIEIVFMVTEVDVYLNFP